MSTLTVRLQNYRPAFADIDVELEDDGPGVVLTVHPEQDGEERVDRTLLPDEARALAAALEHFAEEAER